MLNQKNLNNFIWIIIILSFGTASILLENEINRDGIVYLKQAFAFSYEFRDYKNIFEIHDLPLYSYLIFKLSNIFNINLFLSAKLINILFFIPFVIFYKKIIDLLFSNFEHLFLISLLSFLTFGNYIDDYLPMIVRDNVFLTLFIIYVYYFSLFIKNNKFKFALIALCLCLLSIFFRVEGVALFIFSLCYLIFINRKSINKIQFSILFLLFILLLYLFANIFIFRQNLYYELILNIENNLLTAFSGNIFINKDIQSHIFLLNLIFFPLIFLLKFIKGLGLFQILILFFNKKIRSISVNNFQVTKYFISLIFFLLSLVFLNLIITGAISKRYFLPSYLIISFFLPYLILYLNQFLTKIFKHNYLKLNVLVIFFIFIYSFNAVFDNKMVDKSKLSYDKQAADWISDHVQNTGDVYYINDRIKFYLNKIDWFNISLEEAIKSYSIQYLVLDEPYSKVLLVKEYDYKLVKRIPEKNTKLFIFKKEH